MNAKTFAVPAALLVCALAVVKGRRPAPQGRGVALIARLDASDSVRAANNGEAPLLGAEVNMVAQLGELLRPQRDRLTCFRVDAQTQEFYDGAAPLDPDAFHAALIQEMTPRPPRGGTFPAKFWAEAARRAAKSSLPIAVLYAGDADNDDLRAASLAALRTAGAKLARNRRVVAVYICGANPKNWAVLRFAFAPLGDRLHLQAPADINPASLLSDLDAARTANPSANPRPLR